jgi:hypothetical protein
LFIFIQGKWIVMQIGSTTEATTPWPISTWDLISGRKK